MKCVSLVVVSILAFCALALSSQQTVNLEPLLFVPGDLPGDFSAGSAKQELPEMFSTLPTPLSSIYQTLLREGKTTGGVAVLMYESRDDPNKAFDLVLAGMSTNRDTTIGLGERAAATSKTIVLLNNAIRITEVAFQRCAALAHIRVAIDVSNNQNAAIAPLARVIAYGRLLDGRLRTAVCRG